MVSIHIILLIYYISIFNGILKHADSLIMFVALYRAISLKINYSTQ